MWSAFLIVRLNVHLVFLVCSILDICLRVKNRIFQNWHKTKERVCLWKYNIFFCYSRAYRRAQLKSNYWERWDWQELLFIDTFKHRKRFPINLHHSYHRISTHSVDIYECCHSKGLRIMLVLTLMFPLNNAK